MNAAFACLPLRAGRRTETAFPRATPQGAEASQPVTLVDMSIDGSLVRSPVALGSIGDVVRLDFAMLSDIGVNRLSTLARICHSNQDANEDGVLVGLLFENNTASDKVAIKSFVLSNLD